MLIGRVQPKTFRIEFKRHFISLKRRTVRLTNHGAVKDSTFFLPGAVYLEEKARPSQELSTSSDVSVRAEVEDCPLPGNRKLSPSQFFNPFISMASLNESDNHRRFQDEDVLLDPDNLQPDVACLEFIRLQIQSVKNEASFKESFSTPQSLKTSADDCDDDSNLNSSQVSIPPLRPYGITSTNSMTRGIWGLRWITKKIFGPMPSKNTFQCKFKNWGTIPPTTTNSAWIATLAR